jgi:retron-type reverse transcriptase
MHDRGKSDSAIVAAKPTNNAGQPAAEPVEPRAGTKRNAGEQSTYGTQCRARVIQALARVRKAAKQRKKEKFTALFHHLSVDLLREAFLELKRDAAPGMDGLTWQTYAADLERKLTDLHARVHRGAYRASPSRRTYIPKADGEACQSAVNGANVRAERV